MLARSTGVAATKPTDVKAIIHNMKTARATRLPDAASDKRVADKGDAAGGEGYEDAGMPVRKRPSACAGGAKASKQLKKLAKGSIVTLCHESTRNNFVARHPDGTRSFSYGAGNTYPSEKAAHKSCLAFLDDICKVNGVKFPRDKCSITF